MHEWLHSRVTTFHKTVILLGEVCMCMVVCTSQLCGNAQKGCRVMLTCESPTFSTSDHGEMKKHEDSYIKLRLSLIHFVCLPSWLKDTGSHLSTQPRTPGRADQIISVHMQFVKCSFFAKFNVKMIEL